MNKKTVLITGASRGIGLAVAHEFARHGCNLIINCIYSRELLYQLKDELESAYGINCLASVGDVGQEDYVNALFLEITKTYGTIDVLVNNAGISMVGLLTDLAMADWSRILSANLTSVFLCSKAAAQLMLKSHQGRIINISSVWGNAGASCEAAYSATKGGVNAFTRALAKELALSNIQVNALACGAIDTAMNAHLSAAEKECLEHDIPANRMGNATEAAIMVYSIAGAPAYLTGQVINLDGGWIS